MFRWSVLRWVSCLGLAAILAACSSEIPSTTGSVPSPSEGIGTAGVAFPAGLIAVQEYQPGEASVFSGAVFDNASISGVALRVNWRDLEPAANQFDWGIVDGVFASATASHKFVVLILVPGFGTPDWALEGVATAKFARQYGLGTGEVGDLPMPWDQTYLAQWVAFLQAVADRYGTNPEFRMIAAAGPTSVSVEMSLPNQDPDIARWIALGYTPSRYVAAWKTVFQAYFRIFPRQYVSLALYPGLPVGNSGARDTSQRTATPLSILAAGLLYKDRFALQTSGLTGSRTGSDLYSQVSSNSGVVVTGFQLTTSATMNPGQMGDASDPVHALALTLQLGVAADVDFLEVYEADVLNPAMQDVLRMTEGELPH